MQKRSLGILACAVLIGASCETSTQSQPPEATNEPGASAQASAGQPSSAPVSNLAAEQILRIAISGEPATLDPTLAEGNEVMILRALHRPLVYLDEHLQVVPGLAEWSISADATMFTFRLRDALYSNGDPIVAGDLVYSWKRLADPRTAAGYAYVIADVVGGPELLAMRSDLPGEAQIEAALDNLGVSAPDDRTFVVHLNRPATYFLSAMTLWVFGPLQEQWITGANPTEATNYVSSGPFVLDTWKHNSEIVLKPNPNWYGHRPTLTELQISIFGEPAQAQAAYEAGEIDLVITPSQDVQSIRNDPVLGAEAWKFSVLGINYYSFNNFQDPGLTSFNEPGPTANKNFRIALSQAIDKQAVIDATYGGVGRVANSFIMPGIPGHQPDLNPYPHDLTSATKHMDVALAELGVATPSELGKLKFGFPAGEGREPQVAFLAEAWRQAFGLQTTQLASEGRVFGTQRTNGDFDVSWSGWGADYPHANNQLDGLFTCGGGNSVQYCNAAFDALLARAAVEPDQDKQVAIYNEAQTLLVEDAPFLPIVFPETTYEVKPYVSGLTVTPADAAPGSLFYETIQILEH